jgi:hypothetical protein
VCARTARARASAHVRPSAWLNIHLSDLIYGPMLFKFAVTILQLTTSSMGYVLFIFTHRVHACASVLARAWLTHSLIFGRILFKFAGHILQMTTSYMGYILIMFTHPGHTRVINCSPFSGRVLFKVGVNILHITTSRKGYVLFMFTHRAHACERALRTRAWLISQLSLDGFSSNLLGPFST